MDESSRRLTRPADVPVMVLGVGSNVLVRDGGVPGIVIRLGRGFAKIEVEYKAQKPNGTLVVAGQFKYDLKANKTF